MARHVVSHISRLHCTTSSNAINFGIRAHEARAIQVPTSESDEKIIGEWSTLVKLVSSERAQELLHGATPAGDQEKRVVEVGRTMSLRNLFAGYCLVS